MQAVQPTIGQPGLGDNPLSLISLEAMVGVDAPFQNIVVGTVLVLAVWIDIQYRKRT